MFKKAVPVWTEGEAEELNSQLVLRAEIESDDCELWITASSFVPDSMSEQNHVKQIPKKQQSKRIKEERG